MKKKTLSLVGASLLISMSLSLTSLAGQWVQDERGWRYQEYDGTVIQSESGEYESYYIDGNGDGVAELYFFDENGYMMTNTEVVLPAFFTFPETVYSVNSDGVSYLDETPMTITIPQVSISNEVFKGLIKPEYSNMLMKNLEFMDANYGTKAENRPSYDDALMLNLPEFYALLEDDKVVIVGGYCEALFANPTLSVEEINNILGVKATKSIEPLFGEDRYTWVLQENPYVAIELSNFHDIFASLGESDLLKKRMVNIMCLKE